MSSQWIEKLTLQQQLIACDVEIWLTRLTPAHSVFDECRRSLSDDEVRRAERFTHEGARNSFIVGRGALRSVLSGYLQRPPRELQFTYGPSGKPHFSPESTSGDVRFNLSHSGDIVLIAVARGHDVGIDLELMRDDADVLAIAERFFNQAENAWLAKLPSPERTAAFFRLWTRKEALLKGLGHGIGWGFDRLDLSSVCDTSEIPIGLEPVPGKRWLIFDVQTLEGCQAAVAVERG